MVVYKITVGGRVYVGSSKNFEQRQKEHLRHLRNNSHHCLFLQRQYNKYGSPVFTILEKASSIEEMHQLEEKWILKIGVLNSTNSAVGGDRVSQLTGKAKEEWKQKLKARKNSGNCNVFLHLTEEERNSRLKVWSEVKKGSRNGRYKYDKPIKQLNKKTGELVYIFQDLCEVKSAGFEIRNVVKCLKKIKSFNSCKGYRWEWID
jgi:group I intron endonuclease